MGLLCLYTHFICYLGSGSRAGSIPARYVSPMAELLRLQRGRPVKRKGLAEKGEKKRVNVFYFIRLLVSSGSVQELFQAAGIAAAAFVLLLGFIFFLLCL